ncbi:hypothetical protein M3649_13690 [Ureibacillus chungkukjangi]|uniref:hypothetical protein n=1 Tax=Ureibacillus chungkukjangi TaxID=1202712 RepID=UPI00203CCEBA|nr:hypothetical protein [Ureibacillus chungkukjangi]MCM3389188.1 hypothetical protein [Ureibacillus chungkukjangi]
MQFIISRVECPNCNGEATEYYDYKSGMVTGSCEACEKDFSDKREVTGEMQSYRIMYKDAYGIFSLGKKDGSSHVYMFNSDIEEKVLAHFAAYLEIPEVDSENSFIAQYSSGAFFVKYGKVPSNFLEIYAENYEIYKPFLQAVETKYPRWRG